MQPSRQPKVMKGTERDSQLGAFDAEYIADNADVRDAWPRVGRAPVRSQPPLTKGRKETSQYRQHHREYGRDKAVVNESQRRVEGT